MKKIFLTALSGLPDENLGGPNKVISQIISKIELDKYDIYYLSKNSFFKLNNKLGDYSQLSKFKYNYSIKLFSKSSLYRKLFTSSIYLHYFFKNSIQKVSTIIEKEIWDIVHSHDCRALFNLKNKKGKVILTLHSKGNIVNDMIELYGNRKTLNPLYRNFELQEKKTLELADVITFPSYAAKELFFSQTKSYEYESKTKVIYNGIDLEKVNKAEIDNNFLLKWNWLKQFELRILTVGAHIEAKNIDQILKVFSLLKVEKPKGCFLICIGSGNKTKELYQLARSLKISDNIKFLSSLPNYEVLKLMKICNIYLSLSKNVIFDYVILEALACGMNVFASNEGGNREIINNENGYLVDIYDINSIVHKIINIKPVLNLKAIESIKNFSLSNMMKEFKKIYEQ